VLCLVITSNINLVGDKNLSRIGKKPVQIPSGVKVEIIDSVLKIKGPKGELQLTMHPDIKVEIKNDEVIAIRSTETKKDKALHGLSRALINNCVVGVKDGFQKKLEIVGVGYRAEMKGKNLQLSLGYSHPILFSPSENIKIETPTQTSIIISGIDKQLVGVVAAKIRSFRPPEPYKGKGIKVEGEYIRRKAGKTAGKQLK
jgi:large subunit ribosomal protein L6